MDNKITKTIPCITDIDGVAQYILVHSNGKIANHNIENPDTTAKLVISCGKIFFTIGKSNFNYSIFRRKNKKCFFIFPVGNYYLGVIKKEKANTFDLADHIIKFLGEL